ncbi:zinc finger protein 28-like [Malaya genurostris]|uniref:zinc finger protein 28-like n=1 Tax=Malaya genurostris TaxID=325434 RepID=UPI0026F402AA|nr:zinc finger protein 28-like [Malaya genurostris]
MAQLKHDSLIVLRRPKVCRVCRAPDNDDLISVQLIQENVSISRMIEDLSGIQVVADKNLPQNVCLACLDRVRNAYQLRLQCIHSDQRLRDEFYGSVVDAKEDSEGTVKLEIEALDLGLLEYEEIDEQDFTQAQHIELLEKRDLLQYLNESNCQSHEERNVSDEELIAILAPEESEYEKRPSYMYLKHYDETEYEVVQQNEYYECIKFIVFQCCGCPERFPGNSDLLAHGQLVHRRKQNITTDEFYGCPICFRQFTKQNDLLSHRRQNDGDRYHCQECDLLLDSQKRMIDHLEHNHSIPLSTKESYIENSDQEEEFVPLLTLASFDNRQYKLIPTDQGYDLVEFTWFLCCGCKKLYETKQELEKHSKDTHAAERNELDEDFPFECCFCYQRFSEKATLECHQDIANQRRIACRMCKALFEDKSTHRKHLIDYHGLTVPVRRNDSEAVPEELEMECEGNVMMDIKKEMELKVLESLSEEESMQEVEFIEDFSESDDMDSEEDYLEVSSSVQLKARNVNKYLPTRQRKEMGLVPGNALRVIEELDGYNIVEILKQRCCRCLEFFDSLDELNEHTKEHMVQSIAENQASAKPIKYQCEFCLKSFDIAMVYVLHKRIREQKQFYQCRLCEFVLDSESRLKNHMMHNEKHAKFFNLTREDVSDRYTSVQLPGARCCGCGQYFDNESALAEHSRTVHPRDRKKVNQKRTHACAVCDKRCNNQAAVDAHQKKNGSTVQYYCKLCDFETPSKARMLKHLYSSIHNQAMPSIEVKNVEVGVRKAGTLRYCCFDGCHIPFHDFNKLQEHVNSVHQTEKEANVATIDIHHNSKSQCDCCFRIFQSVTLLRQHQLFTQRKSKSYVCSICGVAKKNKTALTVHEMMHTGEKPYACTVCDKRFSSPTILTSHMKCHVPKQYQCPECGDKFARGENLKRHIRYRHSEATYCCTYCPRKLKTHEAKALHERSHTGEKPFTCRTEGCDKRYASITDRRRHEMASHTGERPHKCSYCLASFVRKRQLTLHERKHTGERPFVCNSCGKAFIDAPLLKKHTC